MSAMFKNSRKKLSQTELRKIMHDHKEKTQPTKKIDSPLAKYPFLSKSFPVSSIISLTLRTYNETGQLTCILCKSVVKSEAIWPVHINSKQHRQNIEAAKQLKEKTQNFTTPAKRSSSAIIEEPVPAKKLKGILKNSQNGSTKLPSVLQSNIEVKSVEIIKPAAEKAQVVLPDEPMDVCTESGEVLPEGFFDDPKLDAKARNKEFKDPIEEEWEKFQREIKDADHISAAIIAGDQEEATNERQIDEIEEQMKNWSRVVHLEKKKVEVIHSNADEQPMNVQEESSSSENEDIDEFLDWRCKKAYK